MVGYYPQLQEGELLYSATARLAAAIYPGRGLPYCAERLLGNPHSSFGLLLPNNVDMLLKNIPAVTGLSREDALRGSIYYLQAPLLDEWEGKKLSSSVFACGSTNTNGLRTFNTRGAPTVLKYCVACARRDAALKKPAIWRVVPNHPGSIACHEHGIRLQISDAPVAGNGLCDPAQWIKLDAPLPPVATEAELAIARDFAWIYAQRGRVTPGFKRIMEKLREAFLLRAGHTNCPGYIDNAALLQAAKDSISFSAQSLFAPQFRQLAKGYGPSLVKRTTLHAYSLNAYLAGTSLIQVLTDLAKTSAPPLSGAARSTWVENCRIQHYKDRIQKFIIEHPRCTRSQIYSAYNHAVDRIRAADPEWFELHMPASQSHRPGPHRCQQWNSRDEELCALISSHVAKKGTLQPRSIRDALIKLNLPERLFTKAKGRLPKALALLASLTKTPSTPTSRAANSTWSNLAPMSHLSPDSEPSPFAVFSV